MREKFYNFSLFFCLALTTGNAALKGFVITNSLFLYSSLKKPFSPFPPSCQQPNNAIILLAYTG